MRLGGASGSVAARTVRMQPVRRTWRRWLFECDGQHERERADRRNVVVERERDAHDQYRVRDQDRRQEPDGERRRAAYRDGRRAQARIDVREPSDDTNRVAIEVDVSYTYNSTALTTNTQQYGGNINGSVTTLSDLLLPGKLMYITGKDQNGSEYVASDVLAVNTGTQTADNTLGTNAQWDYDVLDSELPQAAQTKTGSMVFIVSSTAKDLTLHIITANKNASPTNEEAVGAGNNYHYTLDLS